MLGADEPSVIDWCQTTQSDTHQVYDERTGVKNCYSAKDGIDMNALLQEIVDNEVYKKDYQDITEKILFDKVDYSTAIKGLRKVIEFKLF